ncbi:MAG: NADH-quinone oxidoreductase subunit L [Candidatus Dadabacteria bacterium]|nr:MAG: NADH-quinone oxidoreductase subunit L [Candidatus Dadabacteria bacterium]
MEGMSYIAFIPLFPLLGALISYLVGLRFRWVSGWIASLASCLSFWAVYCVYSSLPEGEIFKVNLFTWMDVGGLKANFSFAFDALSAVMCLVVTGVGSLIHIYSISYMAQDKSKHRYFAYLNLFLFSMLLLVLGANFLVLFIGWEGVGLCSYLLIGFWFENLEFAKAGRKAFIVNRIGDAGFLLAIFLAFYTFNTIDFSEISAKIANYKDISLYVPVLTAIALCLFVGATGKSAQIPLYVWLPDAMAGPTPVSALIHAATMVTAGVYMMARTNFIFDHAPVAMATVSAIGCLTALLAATIAIAQYDIKKVLAYSTVSQLGFMFMAAGAGAYWVAIFHLVTHAFFKACLFLCSGSVIHACHHEQDMRKMGGLASKMPITFATYLVATFAISGIAPLSGYYSKHAILSAFGKNPYTGAWASFLGSVASFTALLTAFYMTRSLCLTFLGRYRGHHHPHESPILMTLPLVVLAGSAAVAGFWGGELYEYLTEAIPSNGYHFHYEMLGEAFGHSLPSLGAIVLAFVLYTRLDFIVAAVARTLPAITSALRNKYYIDEIYGRFVVEPLKGLSYYLWRGVDQMVIDGAVNGTATVAGLTAEMLRAVQNGRILSYAMIMAFGVVLVLIFGGLFGWAFG